MLRVTIDTNVLEGDMQRIRNALVEGLDVEIAPTTVTLRERGTTKPPEESVVAETGVWNESRWGEFVLGAKSSRVRDADPRRVQSRDGGAR